MGAVTKANRTQIFIFLRTHAVELSEYYLFIVKLRNLGRSLWTDSQEAFD